MDLLRYFGISKAKADKAIIKTSRDTPQPAIEEGTKKGRKKQRRGSGSVGNDLDIQLDIRYADDETRNRVLDQQGATQSTRGARSWTVSPSADYVVNAQLSLRLFVDYRSTNPKLSTSFKTTNTQGGLTIRFKLQ